MTTAYAAINGKTSKLKTNAAAMSLNTVHWECQSADQSITAQQRRQSKRNAGGKLPAKPESRAVPENAWPTYAVPHRRHRSGVQLK
jgi:hypothetical protein